ncbi:Fe-S cluster assembly protein SufD [Bacteroidia bacterium]|nr:Fe-S cluster assembly protein SufD [Bacteroidia bacterium]GHU84053.1 Fe-S cluster assembly protein SufD [Bacteroidia bacterium]GHV71162.1 Fe-S cluster assembly protein SufD [Bacteroidia bacterium]
MQQYIDFFKSQRQKIDESCAPLLNAFREKAFESFQRLGFPAYQSEDYQHTDIAGLLKDDFGFYLNHAVTGINPRKVFPCNVPNLNSFKHFVVNGQFYEEQTAMNLPQGVFSGSLNTFAKQYPALFSRYYNRQAAEKGDGLAAFNTMFVQDGYVLYVPENVIVEKPLQLTNISGGNVNSLVNRRMLIILEQGAQAKLLVCDHTTDEKPILAATQVVEIYTGENASFDFYEMEESSLNTVRLTANFVQQAASSSVIANNITLSNGVTRNNYQVDLTGKQAETHLLGMAIVDVQQKIDNFTLINHRVSDCQSNELFKYILDDEAVGTFSGRIIVAKDAQKTAAYQNNRNLLGSNNCRMYSKPQLEIYADDVKCSHGMTTGQLDETVLFYMRSRGIPKEEAALLLKFAFTNDVIGGIRLEGLRDRLKLLIEKRFRGESLKCQGCI